MVSATITTPDGITLTREATVSPLNGSFEFTAGSEVEGTFTIEIDSITCPDGTVVASSRSASADTP